MQGDKIGQQLHTLRQHMATLQRRADILREFSPTLEMFREALEKVHQQHQELTTLWEIVETERQRYQDLFEFAPAGYLVTDVMGLIQEANRAVAAMLKTSQDFLTGKPLILYVAEEAHPDFQNQLLHLRKGNTERIQDWEIHLQSWKGKPFPVTITVVAVRDHKDKLLGLRWWLHDITERKQAEKALRESETRYRRLIELHPDAIVLHRRGQFLYSNAAGAALFGTATPEELMGRAIEEFIRPQSREIFKARAQKLLEEGRMLPASKQQWVRLDGRIIEVEVRSTLVNAEEGVIQSIIRDITEQKAVEQRLAQSERLAFVGELAAGLAHEIKNPLNSLATAANLLADEGTGGAEHDTLLEVVQREVKRLDSVLTEFLHFARPHPPHYTPSDINALCTQTLEALQYHEAAAGKEIETALDPQLPPLQVDADQIKQVLWNLMLNACQAMDTGGILTVSTIQQGNECLLVIQDTGQGIAQEDLEKIFEPFYTRKKGGSGLGLSIVRRLVEAHEGRIAIESAENQGTKVTITLPLCREA